MRCSVLASLCFLLIIGCDRKKPESTVQTVSAQSPQSSDLSGHFPGFSVDVTLSDKAREKLAAGKEMVIVDAMYTGTPTPDARRQHKYEMGEVGLGGSRAEITPGQTAKFGNAVFDHDALYQTDKKEVQLLINVSSGRKSSENNLLECDIYEGSLEAVQHKSIPIVCSLIEENTPSNYVKQDQLRSQLGSQ